MEFAISGHCPGCGAGIEIGGSQRLIACPYCRGRNYLFFRGIPRLVILPKNQSPSSMGKTLLLPYLRFTGAFFHWPQGILRHSLLDTSRLAVILPGLPESLGLRTQVLPARFASDVMDGAYCRRGRAAWDVLVESTALSGLAVEMNLSGEFSETAALDRRKSENHAEQKPATTGRSAWIGETAAIIYMPVLRHSGRWFDGLSGRVLPVDDDRMSALPASKGQSGWQPDFLSAFCPNCGGELQGGGQSGGQGGGLPGSRASNSLVLHCPACERLWWQEAGAWRQLPWDILGEKPSRDSVYLPFWRLECADKSNTIAGFADFLTLVLGYGRFSAQPLADMPLSFLIPAWKMAPPVFLRAARLLTINQERLPPMGPGEMTAFFPVTLPPEEARQAVTPFLVSLNRKKLMETRLVHQTERLVFVPFEKTAGEFIHRDCGFSLPRSLEFLSPAV